MESVPAEHFKVLVAGGGIAGLETILALRTYSEQLPIELLCPDEEFELVPVSVLEPFGSGGAPKLSLEGICRELGVEHTRDRLSEVWPGERRVLTDRGTELPYDALMLCLGARRTNVIQDAIGFWGGAQASAIERIRGEAAAAGAGQIILRVPEGVSWPLPLYEIALMLADRLGGSEVSLQIVTPERSPLEGFGPSGSARVAELLDTAGISFHGGGGPGEQPSHQGIQWTIALPTLDVPEIPALPQGSHGFLEVDASMRVEGVERVWAAGDATWFPLKQGGIATQMADTAAAEIARTAGLAAEPVPFAPVLRAALMTADGPYYLRAGEPDSDGEQKAPLWWPPAKVAGRHLAPFLAERIDGLTGSNGLVDIPVDADRADEFGETVALALAGARLDAEDGDYKRALHWLEIAQGLQMTLPEEYRQLREEWQRQVGASSAPSP